MTWSVDPEIGSGNLNLCSSLFGHHKRKIDFRRGLKQGYLDQLVAYHKPQRAKWLSEKENVAYPLFILVRHLKYKVEQKGFRTREISLATTVLDARVYEADELASL